MVALRDVLGQLEQQHGDRSSGVEQGILCLLGFVACQSLVLSHGCAELAHLLCRTCPILDVMTLGFGCCTLSPGSAS